LDIPDITVVLRGGREHMAVIFNALQAFTELTCDEPTGDSSIVICRVCGARWPFDHEDDRYHMKGCRVRTLLRRSRALMGERHAYSQARAVRDDMLDLIADLLQGKGLAQAHVLNRLDVIMPEQQ
jgi:hypothetical protein